MASKRKKLKLRNGIAVALHTPVFHQRIVSDKRQKEYLKSLRKEIQNEYR